MTITTPAPAAAPVEENNRKRAAWRPMAAAAAAGSVLLITGFGVWASLNAQATGVQSVNSGDLTLAVGDAKSIQFSQTLSNMAPGDVVSRYVTVTNTGSLDGKSLSMKVASTGSQVLIADNAANATKAVRVTVANCADAAGWSATGTCTAANTKTLINDVMLGDLAAANPFANITSIVSKGVLNLKVAVTLPEQTEVTVNGVQETGTVQGANVALTYTFAETQRDAKTTEGI